MTERSPSVQAGIKLVNEYGVDPKQARAWLDENPLAPIKGYNYPQGAETVHTSGPIPSHQDTITVPGAEVSIHYDIPPGAEYSEAKLHYLNKGMYQGGDTMSYGGETPNVPRDITVDIKALVEEGEPHYPFSANREQIDEQVTSAIRKWVRENIITGVTKKRVAAIQKKYDAIDILDDVNYANGVHFFDEGFRYTKDELNDINNSVEMSRAITVLEQIHKDMLDVADVLGWTPEDYSATWKLPSERLKKFGLLFQAPNYRGTTLGIHIPRPDDMNNSAILINLMEHLNNAVNGTIPPNATPAQISVFQSATPIERLGTMLTTTLAHEHAHIPGGGHDKNHSYRDADLRSAIGSKKTIQLLKTIERTFGDGRGGISPEISRILQVYNDSRLRPASGDADLLATGISSERPTTIRGNTPENVTGTRTGREEPGPRLIEKNGGSFNKAEMEAVRTGQVGVIPEIRNQRMAVKQERMTDNQGKTFEMLKDLMRDDTATFRPDFLKEGIPLPDTVFGIPIEELPKELWNFSRAITTTMDLSAPGRQGLPLITSMSFWRSLKPMIQSWKSQGNYDAVNEAIRERALFKRTVDAKGKVQPSYADMAGLELTELGGPMLKREEAAQSRLAEMLPGAGRAVKASNRAYTAYLNSLRADTFENLIKEAQKVSATAKAEGQARPGLTMQKFTPLEADMLNPDKNVFLRKQIADFVNTATGRGPLRTAGPGFKRIPRTDAQGKLILNPDGTAQVQKFAGMAEWSLEQHAQLMTNTFFAPRLMASRVRMLNPMTYAMAPPMLRKQYIKAAMSVAGAWGAVAGTAALAGELTGADVSVETDITSTDFGKVRVGNTRLDPGGGFQQFLVGGARFALGQSTAAAAAPGMGHQFELGQGYRAETRGDVAVKFLSNKLNPMAKFGFDAIFASQYRPFYVTDRAMQLFIPLFMQDMYELAREDKSLFSPVAAAGAFVGMGTQTYERGTQETQIIPDWLAKYDVRFTGGAPGRAYDELLDTGR